MPTRPSIPAHRTAADDVIARIEALRSEDVDWRRGRVFSLVYHPGAEHERLLQRAYAAYASANLVNPIAFKGLKRLESEVVQMAASLFHGPTTAVGSITSGGTESILVAVYTLRERWRQAHPLARGPELIAPRTIHPAFDKAAHYFGVRLRKVEIRDDLRADVGAMKRCIGRHTIGLCASAPRSRCAPGCRCTSTPASAASSSRGSSGWAARSSRGTSACPASRRSRPTCTSSATAARAPPC